MDRREVLKTRISGHLSLLQSLLARGPWLAQLGQAPENPVPLSYPLPLSHGDASYLGSCDGDLTLGVFP